MVVSNCTVADTAPIWKKKLAARRCARTPRRNASAVKKKSASGARHRRRSDTERQAISNSRRRYKPQTGDAKGEQRTTRAAYAALVVRPHHCCLAPLCPCLGGSQTRHRIIAGLRGRCCARLVRGTARFLRRRSFDNWSGHTWCWRERRGTGDLRRCLGGQTGIPHIRTAFGALQVAQHG